MTEPTGFLLVDKPAGCTSHDVVGRVRYLLRTKRVGHAGTLDPMATGLLVLAAGRATRLLGQLTLSDKTYLATIRLGRSTTTDDAEGSVLSAVDPGGVSDQAILTGLTALTGDLLQVPSSVSAIKVDGRRAYDLVRAGVDVELKARPVHVDRFELAAPIRRSAYLDLDVVVDCTTGTYVRALARDLGAALGVGGHLTALRRNRVGPFTVEDAVDVYGPAGPPVRVPGERVARTEPPHELVAAAQNGLQPVEAVVSRLFPVRQVTGEQAAGLRHGRPLPMTGRPGPVAAFADTEFLALLADSGDMAKPVLVWVG